jgi:hypothetical protein
MRSLKQDSYKEMGEDGNGDEEEGKEEGEVR